MLVKARMTFNQNFTKYWLPVIFWTCFIFWISTETFSSQHTSLLVEKILLFLVPGISPQDVDLIHASIRKSGHVTEYFFLGILVFRALRGGSTVSWNWRWSFFALIVVVLWAAIDEFHQSFVPTRTASFVDVSLDTVGGILAQFVIALRHRFRKR
jgi:VanZ family protein